MSNWIAAPLSLILGAICIGPALAGDSDPWIVGKVLGDVSVVHKSSSEPARKDLMLVASDTIRTGKNGRVVLTRGQESIMVSPGTTISLPEAARAGMSTIIQRSGTIVLEVEKQNVQHFEVETPFLAAVVKGTRFEVRVGSDRAKVSVLRGQVQVADFKSGQIGLVTMGQAAAVAQGHFGLSLSGAGPKAPIQQGTPRHSALQPSARTAAPAAAKATAPNGKAIAPAGKAAVTRTGSGGIRIMGALGPVHLDVHKATGGLARTEAAVAGSSSKPTVWSGGQPTTASAATAQGPRNSTDSAAASDTGGAGSKSSGNILSSIFGTTSSPAPALVPSPSPTSSAPSIDSGISNPPAATVVSTASNPPANSTGSSTGSTGTGSPVAVAPPGDTGGSTSSSAPSNSPSNAPGNSSGSNAGGNGNGNSANNSSGSNTGGNGNNSGNTKSVSSFPGLWGSFGNHGDSHGSSNSGKEGSPVRGGGKK